MFFIDDKFSVVEEAEIFLHGALAHPTRVAEWLSLAVTSYNYSSSTLFITSGLSYYWPELKQLSS
jgi:hypothetical protein